MIRARPLLKLCGSILPLAVGVIAALVLLSSVSVRSAQNPAPPKNEEVLSSSSAVNDRASLTSPKEEKKEPKNSGLDKTKADAAELSALADQLRDELKKMNVNVLPLDVIEKTQKLEKLARKIKGEVNKQ